MRITILADDLTGANAVAALLKHEGFQATVHLHPDRYPQGDTKGQERSRGVHVWNVGTRNISHDSVDERLSEFAHLLCTPVGAADNLLGLRIDSTLRGCIAETVDFLLQRRNSALALVVPAFPASGRTTENAIHFVDGVPVHKTHVGHDPFSPVSSPDLRVVIGDASAHRYGCLSLREIRGGMAQVHKCLTRMYEEGVKVVLCDSATDDDIDNLARAVAKFAEDNRAVSLFPVDPGPFTAALSKHLDRVVPGDRMTVPSTSDATDPSVSHEEEASASRERGAPLESPLILGISASIMHNAKRQMDFLERDVAVHMYHYRGESADDVIHSLVHQCPKTKAMADTTTHTMADTDGMGPFKSTIFLRTDTWDLPTEKANSVVQYLPEVVRRILMEYPSISGIYLSGGEAAGFILTALGATRLSIEEELAPLTTLSRPENGLLAGKWIVTKGGLIGDEAAVSRAAETLMNIIKREGVL